MTMSFEGKVVIVTGASSGIGAATAVLFSKEGANVTLVGRNESKLNDVASRCVTKHLIVKADVSDEAQAKSIVDRTVREFGRIDVLVNNAGIARFGSVGLGNILPAYDEVMATNVRAVMHLTSLCVENLLESKGNVVNVSSVGGLYPPSKNVLTPYSVSKAALNMLTQCMALELGEYGVRVNTVSPGPVVTDIMANSGVPDSAFSWKDFEPATALKRVGQPEEIADLIMFLSSDKAKSITGANYLSDNGLILKRSH